MDGVEWSRSAAVGSLVEAQAADGEEGEGVVQREHGHGGDGGRHAQPRAPPPAPPPPAPRPQARSTPAARRTKRLTSMHEHPTPQKCPPSSLAQMSTIDEGTHRT
ncbi:unnamed protein product [Arctia plantaginis]|uniref:Uncharacterized protein n=1 Tax=Arctia plantaginis TaxID=874455 RepID=A0A8S1AD05_ARCPL|nr:unnamed protein product [Arctia plantaginis]